MRVSKRRVRRKAKVRLWVLQALLAGVFIMSGGIKLFLPMDSLSPKNPWVTQVPEWLPRLIGLAEVAGGLGMLLPSALQIRPKLTVTAAFCLALVMLLAIVFHYHRSEFAALPITVILFTASVYVGWARLKKYPIAPKVYENPFADPFKR